MKKLNYLIGLFLLTLQVQAWGNTITGKISDISGNAAVEGAYIYLYNTNFIVSTDVNGEFAIDSVPLGTYTIIIDHQNYVQKVIKNFEVTNGVNAIEINSGYNLSVQSYPNPFRKDLNIEFSINKPQNITIEILDIQGKVIDIVANNYFTPGKHTVVWNSDLSGIENKSGRIYFYRIQGEKFSHTDKIIKVQ